MVQSFYIMKLNKKSLNMEKYYNDLHNVPIAVYTKHLKRKAKCRVCLQDGDSPVTSVTNHHDIKEALSVFGAIEFDADDENPTYLCYVCYKFLKSAVLFRRVSQRTNETLKQALLKQSPSHFKNYEPLSLEDVKPNQVYLNKEDIIEKQEEYFIDIENQEEPEEDDSKIECPICKKVLNKAYYHRTHSKLHDPNYPKRFVCDICGKSFKIRSVYNLHMKRHETRYIFKCQLCPYAARYQTRLSMHMRVHTGDLKYMCTECPARYISKGTLTEHIRLKHTEPQYKCGSCDKAFHNNLNLQRHVDVVHLGIINHECNICGIGFGYRRDLMKHQRNVHKRANLRSVFRKSTNKSNSNSE